jgi:hypothetical protein
MKLKSLIGTVIVIGLLCAAFPAGAPAAEPTDTQRQAMELKIQELRDRLALTPEQEEKLTPLVQARNDKLRELFSRYDADSSRREKRAMFSEARAIQEDFSEKLKPILTTQQMNEWEAFRKEARAEARERYRNRAN